MNTNIRLWIAACKELNIDWEILHPAQALIRIRKNNNFYYFANHFTPFNSQSVGQIFKDKEYSYEILRKRVNISRTSVFLSPDFQVKQYVKFRDIDEMVESIEKTFPLPVIIKRNSGSAGKNVFLCQDIEQVKLSLQKIFNVNSKDYDPIALAQEYIDIAHEYRAVIFNNSLLLLYEKNKADANFVGNLSPLHWEGAKAVQITELNLISAIENFVKPIFQEIPLNYAGVDVAIDKNGKFWLIEINSQPIYNRFIKDNDEKVIVEIFKTMLKKLD